ncbi:MAG TPA: DUF2971 domain-containing protein [Rhizomicrobium sp.]|nr:DUF2971 domain-containing protein [Rhizomicrobium sp.]
MTAVPDPKRIARVFLPYFSEQSDYLKEHGIQLAYYTSCETADKIIRNREFWLRDCRLMNDSTEVTHGISIIDAYFSGEHGKAFFAALDEIRSGVARRAFELFHEWKTARDAQAFVMSFSRHAQPKSPLAENEKAHGRLSMWRGYGGPDNVAMIFKVPFGQDSDGSLMLFLSPVGYFESVDAQIAQVIANARAEKELLRDAPEDMVTMAMFVMFVMAATSLKHPGFMEEDEWRLIYLPSTWRSKLVREVSVEIRPGHPEIVCQVPLSAFSKAGISGIDLKTALDRVIVGPSEFRDEIGRYIADALRAVGIEDADARVKQSEIPFRRLL